eukprot:scaffold49072_cov15-Tisochrysis_lutea.AAC.1
MALHVEPFHSSSAEQPNSKAFRESFLSLPGTVPPNISMQSFSITVEAQLCIKSYEIQLDTCIRVLKKEKKVKLRKMGTTEFYAFCIRTQ